MEDFFRSTSLTHNFNLFRIFGLGPVGLTEGTVFNMNTVPTFLDNLYSQGTLVSLY